MPRSSRNHNWNNQDQNFLISRNNIPQERQRLLNQLRGIDEVENLENNTSTWNNRRIRRENGINNNQNNNTDGWETTSVDWGRGITSSDANPIVFGSEEQIQRLSGYIGNYTSVWSSYTANMIAQNSYKYIKSYNYIPQKFNFHKQDNESINQYFGIELEIDGAGETDDNAKKVIDFIGEDNVYIKHDGSLSQGFEIVTQPCSYNYHLNQIDYKGLFDMLVKMGYKSHDTQTCGLHIHVNKNFFGDNKTYQDLNISKLLFLFEKYWDKLVLFSRRESSTINRWARRYEMNNDESMFDVLSKAKSADREYNGKYHSINLKHKDTVELRIFKGTLKYETFIATLQLVKRLCDISKEMSIEDVQLITWEDLVCTDNIELNEYLVSKKLAIEVCA
jgi:hypothetical protein